MDNADYLHSHSELERSVKDRDIQNKSHVLIDSKYASLFEDCSSEPIKLRGTTYYKVPTYTFFKRGGVFKNFDA